MRDVLAVRLLPFWRLGGVKDLKHGLVAEIAGDGNRGNPVIVQGIYIGVSDKEELHDVFAAIAHGQVQRRVAAPLTFCIYVGTFGEKESDDLRVTTIGGQVQGSSPMPGFPCVYVGPMEKEEQGCILISSSGRVVKWQGGKFVGGLGRAVGGRRFGSELLSFRRIPRRWRCFGRVQFGGFFRRLIHEARGRRFGFTFSHVRRNRTCP